MIKKTEIIFVLLIILFGCSAQRTIDSISKLQFKIDSITDFELLDVLIENKSELGDFSSSELLKLIRGYTSGNLAASFALNLIVKNPNAMEENSDELNIEIVSLPWELYVDDTKILTGNITEPIHLQGDKPEEKIEIKIYMNIFEIVNKKNINELLQTVLKYGGKNSSIKNISIYTQPVIGTVIGNIKYPQQIKIVDYEFR